MAQLASTCVRPSASNVGLMSGSHHGLCVLSGFFLLLSRLRIMFIQRLSLVYIFRSSLRDVDMGGVICV
jgi:hypothetical protein